MYFSAVSQDSHQLLLRRAERPHLSEKQLSANIWSLFTALNSLRIHLLFFFLQTKFFTIFLSLGQGKKKKKDGYGWKLISPCLLAAGAFPGTLWCSFSHRRNNSRLQHKVHRVIREIPQFRRCACNLHFHSAAATRPRGGYGPSLVHSSLEYYEGPTTPRTQTCSRKTKTKHLKESWLLSWVSLSLGQTLYCHNFQNTTIIVLLVVCNTWCGLCHILSKMPMQHNSLW